MALLWHWDMWCFHSPRFLSYFLGKNSMWSTYRNLKVQALSSHGNFKLHTEQYFKIFLGKVFPKCCEHRFLWDKYRTKSSSVFFIRPIGPLPLLTPLIRFSKNKWANQAGGISSTFSNKELNVPILRGLESENNQVSICYLLLFTRHFLCPGTVPAIRSLTEMSNLFHVAPTGQRLRWKLQRTKSQRFAKIEPDTPRR